MDTRASKRRAGVSVGGGVAAGAAGGSAAAISLDGVGVGGGGGETGDGPPEHLSPGYGAGYDAGFLAGLRAASQGRPRAARAHGERSPHRGEALGPAARRWQPGGAVCRHHAILQIPLDFRLGRGERLSVATGGNLRNSRQGRTPGGSDVGAGARVVLVGRGNV